MPNETSDILNDFLNLKEDLKTDLPNKRVVKAETGTIKQILEAYEGRFLYELIQNARDSAIKVESNADIKIVLDTKEKLLKVFNSGASFDIEALEALCTINLSDKDLKEKEFIGHKGIGFISVLSITDSPKIITKIETKNENETIEISFDRDSAHKQLKELNQSFDEFRRSEVPIFKFPNIKSLENYDFDKYSSVIILPLKKDTVIYKIKNDIIEILSTKNFIFMTNLNEIVFEIDNIETKKLSFNDTKEENNFYLHEINKEAFLLFSKKVTYEIVEDENIIKKDNKIQIAIPLIKNEEDKEIGNIDELENKEIYVYYPTKVDSGFKFFINSKFQVSLDRKQFKENKSYTIEKDENLLIFEKLREMIIVDLIEFIKKDNLYIKDKKEAFKLLCFENNDYLDKDFFKFKKDLIKDLKDKEFIYYDNNKFFKPQNILIVDNKEDEILFDDCFEEKYILFVKDENNSFRCNIRDWLLSLDSRELSTEDIITNIEIILQKKLKEQKYEDIYFIYKKLIEFAEDEDKKEKLINNRIILTNHNELVIPKETSVYYTDTDIDIDEQTKDKISLLNKNIMDYIQKVVKSKFRSENLQEIGLKEFSSKNLLDELIKKEVERKSFSKIFFQLELKKLIGDEKKDKDLNEYKNYIVLPVVDKDDWLSPIEKNIYFSDYKFLNEKNKDSFLLNAKELKLHKNTTEEILNKILKFFGVNNKPIVKNGRLDIPNEITIKLLELIAENKENYLENEKEIIINNLKEKKINFDNKKVYTKDLYLIDNEKYKGVLESLKKKNIILNQIISNSFLGSLFQKIEKIEIKENGNEKRIFELESAIHKKIYEYKIEIFTTNKITLEINDEDSDLDKLDYISINNKIYISRSYIKNKNDIKKELINILFNNAEQKEIIKLVLNMFDDNYLIKILTSPIEENQFKSIIKDLYSNKEEFKIVYSDKYDAKKGDTYIIFKQIIKVDSINAFTLTISEYDFITKEDNCHIYCFEDITEEAKEVIDIKNSLESKDLIKVGKEFYIV